MMRRRVRIKQVPRHGDTLGEQLYVFGLMRAMAQTFRRLLAGLRGRSPSVVVEYPEMKPVIPHRWRGRHRLVLRPDGTPRCIACGLCAEVCPVSCIRVSPAAGKVAGNTRPGTFDIDLSSCIFCGTCVSACPADAIRMDSGIFSMTGSVRSDLSVNIHTLMATPGSFGDEAGDNTEERD